MEKLLIFLEEYYPNEIRENEIIPNQNGILCKYSKLYKDSDIPEIFKDSIKDYINVDIKDELLDKNFNVIFEMKEKKIYDYSKILNSFYTKEDNSKNMENKREKLAIKLLSIIPKENKIENKKTNSDKDIQTRQILLYKLYRIFTKSKLKSYEIENDESNYKIWHYSNRYIYDIIQSHIERNNDILSLAEYIGKDKNKAIMLLKAFISFSKEGKIILNQNNDLCYLEKLKNEGENKSEIIPEELKNISKKLGYDAKNILVHKDLKRPCEDCLSLSELCKKIDDLVKKKYKKQDNNLNREFREAVNDLIEIYFESIDEEKKNYLFPFIASKKDQIILNVIYNKKTRKDITELGKSYGIDAIEKLLKNPELTNLIVSGKLNDDNYKKILENNNNNNNQIIINDNSKKINLEFNSDLISDDNINFMKKSFNNILSYGNELDFSIKDNRKNGILGEVYIYELLKKSGNFKKVRWKMLNKDKKGELFQYNGKKYYINNSEGSPYDIVVETYKGNKYYIEVKSTKNKFGKKVPFYLSQKQIETMETVKYPNKYVLAVVYDVIYNPRHFFMCLSDNINDNDVSDDIGESEEDDE